jgi:hypothetical protein
LALTLFIVSQQPLALFDIKERRSATRVGCIDTPGHNDLLFEDAAEFHRCWCGHSLIEETKKHFPCSGKPVMIPTAIGLLNCEILFALASGFARFHSCPPVA